MSTAQDEQARFREPRYITREWVAVMAPPLAWALGLVAKYALVPFVCGSGDTIWMHVVSVITLVIAAGGAVMGWRLYEGAGGEWPDDREMPLARSRFMAAIALMSGGLFSLAIIAQWITSAFLNPCMGL